MSHDAHDDARRRLAVLTEPAAADSAPAHQVARDAQLLGRLLAAAEREAELSAEDVGAALSLFEELRLQLDRLESRVVMEARRRGMDWRRIALHQGLNSSQAASQRHQRLTTRLEEIRQGVRPRGGQGQGDGQGEGRKRT
ncbi:hypothetical protein [Streptomyces sp. V3I7]|uniref:hypothetical protein n=1 Tax=Streptomyces sp. V3I7 TaxID=3042278 RepID=UPI002782C700|nr:hypothetical protein [Streptomyces sp. V3I7]MDQ0988960.1 hypothetical protein [Streptomyces sp. V3I7]